MSRTVFILGAGASKEGGAPLMTEFLEVAEQLWRRNQVADQDRAGQFELFFRARTALQGVLAKSVANLFNIEEVLGLFEIARLAGRLGALDPKEVEKLPTAARCVITTTLEETLKFYDTPRAVAPPEPYEDFVALVKDVRASGLGDVSAITLNYDIALDCAFHFRSVPVDYCLDANQGRQSDAIPLMKLHGSINWTTCSKCGALTPYAINDYLADRERPLLTDGRSECHLPISRELHRTVHCSDSTCEVEPVIVPPTWNKALSHAALGNVWGRAARELSDAENIIVIGYSLPKTDYYFRHLLGLGMVGDALLRRINICDPDVTVEERSKELLVPAIHARVSAIGYPFSSAIPQLRARFGLRVSPTPRR